MDAADTRLLHSPLGLAGNNCIATLFFCTGSPLGRARQNAALDAARVALESASAGARESARAERREAGVDMRQVSA